MRTKSTFYLASIYMSSYNDNAVAFSVEECADRAHKRIIMDNLYVGQKQNYKRWIQSNTEHFFRTLIITDNDASPI